MDLPEFPGWSSVTFDTSYTGISGLLIKGRIRMVVGNPTSFYLGVAGQCGNPTSTCPKYLGMSKDIQFVAVLDIPQMKFYRNFFP